MTSIKIRKGETKPLIVSFQPFQMTAHSCKVVFCDTNVGEFQHEIAGEVDMPELSTNELRLKENIFVDK